MERLRAFYFYRDVRDDDDNLRVFDTVPAEITYKMALKRNTTCNFLQKNFCFRHRLENPLIESLVKNYTTPLKVFTARFGWDNLWHCCQHCIMNLCDLRHFDRRLPTKRLTLPAMFELSIYNIVLFQSWSLNSHAEYTLYAGGIWKRSFYSVNASVIFLSTPRGRNYQTQQSPVTLDLCLSKTRAGKSNDYCNLVIFERLCFQNVFSSHQPKHNGGVFKFLLFEKCFLKAMFSWRINVDGSLKLLRRSVKGSFHWMWMKN